MQHSLFAECPKPKGPQVMRKHRSLAVVASMLVMSLVLMACGDDGDGDTDTGDTESEDTESEDTESEDTESEDTESEDTESDDEDAAPFYEGKEIEFLIPFGPGGGTDTMARFIAPLMARNTPGEPQINPVNIPGAGATIGSNIFAVQRDHEAAESIFLSSGSSVLPWLLDNPALLLDYRDLRAYMGAGVGNIFYVNPETTGVTSPEEFAQAIQDGSVEWVTGEQTPDSIAAPGLMFYDMIGMDVDVVFGFEGRGPARIAYEQGDTNFNLDITPAFADVEPLIEQGIAVPVFTAGALEGGEVVRDPDFPDLPHMGEMYEMITGEAPSGPQWESIVAFNAAAFSFQKIFWIHQDAPDQAYDDLVAGATAMLDDPDFQEGVGEIFGSYPVLVGEEAQEAANAIIDLDDEVKAFGLDFLVENYDIEDPRLIGQ